MIDFQSIPIELVVMAADTSYRNHYNIQMNTEYQSTWPHGLRAQFSVLPAVLLLGGHGFDSRMSRIGWLKYYQTEFSAAESNGSAQHEH